MSNQNHPPFYGNPTNCTFFITGTTRDATNECRWADWLMVPLIVGKVLGEWSSFFPRLPAFTIFTLCQKAQRDILARTLETFKIGVGYVSEMCI